MATTTVTALTFNEMMELEALLDNLRVLAVFGSDAATRDRNAKALRKSQDEYNAQIDLMFEDGPDAFRAYAQERLAIKRAAR